MKIKVFDERNNKNIVLEIKNIEDAIKKLNINIKEVIIVKNGELVTLNSKINENDEIKFLSVISGG